MKKLKILFILHLPPPVHGSAVVGQYLQESVLINESFDCRFVNLSTAITLTDISKFRFIKIIKVIRLIYNIIKEIIVFRPDMFYMTPSAKGNGYYKDFFIILVMKITGKKIVYHFHNKGISSMQQQFMDKILYRLSFRNSYCILLSPLLYVDVKKYFNIERVSFCPNGIKEGDYPKTVKKEGKICNILFLSNMMVEKGVFTLLEACIILRNKGIPFLSRFIGAWSDINEKDFMAFVSSNNLTGSVSYGGARYGKEKSMCFEQADIFVFPTYYNNEVFPLVLLEAMQYSLPVISTCEGGIPDIVDNGKTGYIVEKNNPHELANHIELLIKDPFLSTKMGLAGRSKFKNQYTFSTWEDNMCNILRKFGSFN